LVKLEIIKSKLLLRKKNAQFGCNFDLSFKEMVIPCNIELVAHFIQRNYCDTPSIKWYKI